MTPARPITGTTGGVVAISGTTNLLAKIDAWKLSSNRTQHNFNGFGDAGESYTYDGPHRWAATCHGHMLAGSNERFDPALYSGTNFFLGSVILGPDAAFTYSGSVKVQNVTPDASYNGGNGIVFNLVGQGPLRLSGQA